MMISQRIGRSWVAAVGVLAVSVGVTATSALWAAPAQADNTTDPFLSALNNAGVGYTDPGSAVEMGQSICPMLSEPGGSFAKTASTLSGRNGISADMAGMFTSVAISMYCPQMMSNFASGDFLQNGDLLNSGAIPFMPNLFGG